MTPDSRRPLEPEDVAAPAVPPPAPETAAAEPEVQSGHGDRGPANDERIKQAIRRHSQREGPKLDDVEDRQGKSPSGGRSAAR